MSNVTTHTIHDNTVYSASISYGDTTGTNPIASISAVSGNRRRIIFTDNKGWGGTGHDELYVHYSRNTTDGYVIAYDEDGDIEANDNVQMHPLYINEENAWVYYADIPVGVKYVSFNNGLTNATHTGDEYVAEIYSEYNEVSLETNAFSSASSGETTNPRAMSNHWNCRYADFLAVGSIGAGGDAQQATTSLNKAAAFRAEYDYSSNALTFTHIAGSTCDVSFNNGILRLTPRTNEVNYSLYKVSSDTSGVEKYYLVRIKPFELRSFEGLQKLYETTYLLTNNSSLDLKTIARGTSPSFTYSYSPHNTDGTFTQFTETPTEEPVTISGVDFLLNRLRFLYRSFKYLGIEYFKV